MVSYDWLDPSHIISTFIIFCWTWCQSHQWSYFDYTSLVHWDIDKIEFSYIQIQETYFFFSLFEYGNLSYINRTNTFAILTGYVRGKKL